MATTSGRRSSSSGGEEAPLSSSAQGRGGLRPVDAARLGALPRVVRRLRETLRYVDYRQAERDCEILAARLLERYPRRELRRFAVRGIPRGGLIVLGMLSYLLDLGRRQLAAELEPRQPLLLVDDCALSGVRFHGALAASASPRVVFAQLYSHPDLRAAVVEREARVECCLAAHDLTDLAPELYGDDYQRWRSAGSERVAAAHYWLGLPELVCFAWGEPDRPLWNPVSRRLEEGWRLLAPQRSLKARAALGPPPLPVASRDWRVPDSVVSARHDGRIWLHSESSDEVFSLGDSGAEMWRALGAWGSVAAATDYLARRYDVPRQRLQKDLEAFVETLAEHGLLEPTGEQEG